jgi:hypothetical protein
VRAQYCQSDSAKHIVIRSAYSTLTRSVLLCLISVPRRAYRCALHSYSTTPYAEHIRFQLDQAVHSIMLHFMSVHYTLRGAYNQSLHTSYSIYHEKLRCSFAVYCYSSFVSCVLIVIRSAQSSTSVMLQ